MNTTYFLILPILIPALLVLPLYMGGEAYAYKVTNTDIKLEVHFNKNAQPDVDLQNLFNTLDNGTLEQNMVDTMINTDGSPVVGQFSTEDIEAFWNVSINHDSGLHKLRWFPEIIEVNVKNGVNFGTLQDLVIDSARPTVTEYLNTYGVTDYTWFLYYDGGLVIEEESTP